MTCTQERFLKDAGAHKMTVIRDDGVDRHITFRNADGGSPYWFEVLTWPGALCIRGDMGTYVFSRLTDMFEFFRTDDRGDPSKLYINRSYWCEKLQAVDCDGWGKGAAKRFDAATFERNVKDVFDTYFDGSSISAERRTELWDSIQSDVIDYASDGDAGTAFSKLSEFHDDEFPRLFEDWCDWASSCEEYTFHFVWNLYAIAWAIRQYDAAKKATAESPETANA
ncbi:hypothetical protein [Pandoraea sputorum]|uniref:hypothetical protein n=1 Tax=Pandoraea sputorum TaxID=93222 RepID=UPI00123EE7D2|nr:hypothetical protein [Pandoraea sputorum]VVE07365.1 hypothetical protein PSP20601_02466 [Pandoraea sputorum]